MSDFNFTSDFGGGGFDSGSIDVSVDNGNNPSPADLSISDQVRSGAASTEVAWGAGVQDVVGGSPPVLVNSNSFSDRLRGIAAAYENPSQAEQLVGGSGGGAFTGPTAVYDPEISSGALDWSQVLRAVPQAVNTLAGAASTVLNGYARLAGVHPAQGNAVVVGGNPAPGGTPAPSLLQRLLGGPAVGTGVGSAPQSQLTGMLLTAGVVLGVGYLVLKRK